MTTSRRELLGLGLALGTVLSARADAAPVATTGAVTDGVLRGFLNIAEGQIHYRYRNPESSGRVPLLMLHGFPSSAWILQPYVSAMGAHRPVYAFDLMGMGDSTRLNKSNPGIDDRLSR